MRLGHGCHRRCPDWIKIAFILGTAATLTGPGSLQAQDSPRPQEPTESVTQTTSGTTAASASDAILYVIRIVEVPTDETSKLIAPAKNAASKLNAAPAVAPASSSSDDSQDANVVQQASYSAPSKPIKFSGAIDDKTIRKLLDTGNVLMAPKIIAYDGESAELFSGAEMPFVTSCKFVKEEEGDGETKIQPIITSKSVGTHIKVTGKLNQSGQQVRLQFDYDHTELKNVDQFTFETEAGPFTVDQPSLASNQIQTELNIPVGGTVAVSGSPISRVVKKQTRVPVLGRIPYVGRLFKNVSATKVDVTPVILISCELADSTELTTEEPGKIHAAPPSADVPQR